MRVFLEPFQDEPQSGGQTRTVKLEPVGQEQPQLKPGQRWETPEEAAAWKAPSAESEALEQPWIDPVDAVAGGLSFAPRSIAAAGARAIPRILAGTAANVATEPIVGGAQDVVDRAMGSAPAWVKAPVNLTTGVLTGGLLSKAGAGMGRAAREAGLNPDFADELTPKGTYFKEAFAERFNPGKVTLEPIEPAQVEEVVPAYLRSRAALPQGQGFETVGGPYPGSKAGAAPHVDEAALRHYEDSISSGRWVEEPEQPRLSPQELSTAKPAEQILREDFARGLRREGQENPLVEMARGRLKAEALNEIDSEASKELLRRHGGSFFAGKGKPSIGLDELRDEAISRGLIDETRPYDAILQDLMGAKSKKEAYADTFNFKPETGTTLYSNPIPQAWRIFTDTYGKYIGTPLWDVAIQKKIPALLEKVPGGEAVNKAMIPGYRGGLPDAPRFNKSIDEMRLGQSIGMDYAVDLGNRLSDLPEADQLAIGGFLRGEAADLPANVKGVAEEAKDALYSLGRQAVDAGLLDNETFFKNAGRYMPRLYTSKEYQSLLTRWNISPPSGMELSRFKARKDIPEEIRKEMGEILTPGYPVAKGVANLTHDIEFAKFFKGISDNPRWAVKPETGVAVPDGWKPLEGKKYGSLNGTYVHPEIHDELSYMRRAENELWQKSLSAWKFGKVVMSPKAHIRNIMSNSVLAHLGGMPMYEQPVWLAKSAKSLANGDETWALAKQAGLLKGTYVNTELRALFNKVSGELEGSASGSMLDRLGKIGKGAEMIHSGMGKMAKLYNAEEEWFKLAMFMHNRAKGMDARSAAAEAEKWLFDYGKVTRFQDRFRKAWYGAPFATFTFKAMPRIAEAAVKTPWRFALPLSMSYGLNAATRGYKIGDTKEQENAKRSLLPDWMQGGKSMWPRVPIVDDYGREYYLNLTYILPWGDIAESGGAFGIPGGIMPFSQPVVKEAWEQMANYDLFSKKPIVEDKETAGLTPMQKFLEQAKQRGTHAFSTFAPTPAIDVMKGYAALRGKPDYKGRERPMGVVAADVFGGFKMYPVDYAEQAQREIAKVNPVNGAIAAQIKGDIKRLAVQAEAAKRLGRDPAQYKEQIDAKVQQLIGLAGETKDAGEAFATAMGRKTPLH